MSLFVVERDDPGFTRPGPIQNMQFILTEMASEVAVGRSFVDDLIRNHMAGKDVVKETFMAEYWICEMAMYVADRCVQLFGGYGYCTEYPVAPFTSMPGYRAGTSEIMKLVVSRSMGL